jgi:hypothetical protein
VLALEYKPENAVFAEKNGVSVGEPLKSCWNDPVFGRLVG